MALVLNEEQSMLQASARDFLLSQAPVNHLRGLRDEECGLASYAVAPATIEVEIDPSVRDETSYRPFIECAVIRGLELDEDRLRTLMKLQENLHWALGRDRKLASIGIYDLTTVTEKIRYTTAGREELRFVPLQSQDGAARTPEEILATHPKGMAYAHLLASHQRVPLLIDDAGQVLSMPPIINSEETRIRQTTTDVLIDVTGITERAVVKTLATIVTSIVEICPAARIEAVRLRNDEGERATPTLATDTFSISLDEASQLIGIPLELDQAIALLEQMRHSAAADPTSDQAIQVTVPSYRVDIMHPVDLIEDLAIAYGYDNIPRKLVPSMTVASERPERILANQVRTTLTGLGFFEAMSLLLSNPEEQYEVLGLDDPGDAVRVAHPVSVEQTMLRTSLMPQLLTLFSLNRGQGLPQRLFEVDDAILLPPGQERPTEALHVTAGLLDMTAGFADIKAVAEALARELRIELTYAPVDHPAFIPGRVASISWDGTPLGLAGEIHPRVLERCRLAQPLAVLELDLQPMLGGKGRG